MSSGKMVRLTLLGFGVIVLAVGLLFAMRLTNARSSEITLPTPVQSGDSAAEELPVNINTISVTQENVQKVIAELKRPDAYSRDIAVESFWDGGSNVTSYSVSVRDGVTSLRTVFDGKMKNIVTTEDYTYIWYAGDNEAMQFKNWMDAPGDEHQKIFTYENIQNLNKSQIQSAGFINDTNGPGIFVKYTSGTFGYVTEVRVSIELGLITGAEQYDGETLVYRMSAGICSLEIPGDISFILPDGVNTLE